MKPIISVKEARKLLVDSSKFTDEQILKIINELQLLSELAIESHKKELLENQELLEWANYLYGRWMTSKKCLVLLNEETT